MVPKEFKAPKAVSSVMAWMHSCSREHLVKWALIAFTGKPDLFLEDCKLSGRRDQEIQRSHFSGLVPITTEGFLFPG